MIQQRQRVERLFAHHHASPGLLFPLKSDSEGEVKLLAAAEPALGLSGTLLDLRVELVDSLEGLCAGILAECLNVALCAASLPVGLSDL